MDGKVSEHEYLAKTFLKDHEYYIESKPTSVEEMVVAEASENSKLCSICCEAERSIMLEPCKHILLCVECSEQISQKCPYCRMNIENKVKVFLV